MLSAKKVLAASMDYTDESVAGAGAIKGAPCEIKSITPITGGNTVTFKWLDSNNVEHTSTMDVMDGQDGEDGKGIASVTINAEEHLIITYTDGSTSDAGEIEVQSAVDSVNGQTGEVVLTASDVNALPDDTTLADLSGDSTHRTVTDAEKTAWNAKSDFSGSYDDLTDKPSIPDEISDLDDTAISSPTNGQVMTYDSTAGKWKNADNNPTITVDSALSTTSENPVQNKVLTTEINKKAEYEEISWEDYQALSYAEKHNGKQYFVTGAPGSAVSASGVSYDNTTSGITADNVQDALDEIAAGGGQITVDSAMSTTSTNPLQNKVITLEVQDMRASMLNDELKLSAVELAVSQLQTSALNTELRLSTAELAVSQLQTSMLNMDGAVDDIEDEIADIVNVYGAKNLIPYPYLNKSGIEFRGVTYTVNADRSVTANGTATGGDSAFFILQRNVDNDFLSRIGQGKFILSGCPASGSLQTYYLNFNYGDAQSSAGNLGQDTGNGKEITIDTDITQYNAQISVLIREGVTVSNLTFYPMLRMASVKDNTYVPYAMTNKQLTDEKLEEVMYEEEIHGINLFKPNFTTKTSDGVTYTVNSDNSISTSGTTTADTRTPFGTIFLEKGTYTLSGNPYKFVGTAETNRRLRLFNSDDSKIFWDDGDGVTFTIDKAELYTLAVRYGNDLSFGSTFKPMLRKADIEDSTYRPYNEQAIQNQLDAQGVLGAKNLIGNPEFPRSGSYYTVQDDNSVVFNGTPSANLFFNYGFNKNNRNYNYIIPIEPGKSYIVNGCPEGGSGSGQGMPNNYAIRCYAQFSDESLQWLGAEYGEGVKITVPSDAVYVFVQIAITAGTVLSNVIFRPMIRLASDSDDTYQPYAMTNRELTKVKSGTITAQSNDYATYQSNCYMYKSGNVVNLFMFIDVSQVTSDNTYITIATLSEKPIKNHPMLLPEWNDRSKAMQIQIPDERVQIRPKVTGTFILQTTFITA